MREREREREREHLLQLLVGWPSYGINFIYLMADSRLKRIVLFNCMHVNLRWAYSLMKQLSPQVW
jgi:hypothetical protein